MGSPAVEAACIAEDLAEEIVMLSKAFKALDSSRLNRRAVVLLVHDMTKLPKRHINSILDALPDLADRYLKEPGD